MTDEATTKALTAGELLGEATRIAGQAIDLVIESRKSIVRYEILVFGAEENLKDACRAAVMVGAPKESVAEHADCSMSTLSAWLRSKVDE